MTPGLSPAARRFLETRVPSLLHLDILMMLRRNPSEWLSAATVGSLLHLSIESTERALEELGAANLVDVKIANSLSFRFSPLENEVLPLLQEIAATHYHNRSVIERVMAHRSTRTTAARAFADAFRLTRRKPDA